jgi:uncharacterized phiE125 gp8 family phage protein
MRKVLKTAPTIEPVTLAEVKAHLRVDSGTLADNLASAQSITPGDHVVAAAYSLEGSGVDVQGYGALVVLDSGTNGTNGTVDAKIQESDDNITFTDWTGGAFTQVTTTNDNAVQEKQYTGTKRYIRVVATVGTATCDFGVSVIKQAATSDEDDLLTDLITAARLRVEDWLNRALITQTWYFYYDAFPAEDYLELGMGTLQSVTAVTYTDSDGDTTTMSASTDYEADTASVPGRVVLKYGMTWPGGTALKTVNPISVEAVVGYGATAASVPENVRRALLILIQDLYEHRGEIVEGHIIARIDWLGALLNRERMWRV